MPQKMQEACEYQRTQMQKEMIIQKLREQGCRITKQRQLLLDIILEEDCACCKEIYYKAAQIDDKIGPATVYRMVNTLEKIGAISRENFYRVVCRGDNGEEACCTVELSDHSVCILSSKMWRDVVKSGLQSCGYIQDQEIESVRMHKELS